MKTLSAAITLAVACMFFVPIARAQYKSPRNYFPKSYPAPAAGGGQPAAPKTPEKQPPAKPQQPKFKDLSVNSQFYFLSDTNREYAWTKISASTAKNTKNGVTQTINGETPVQR